MKYPTLTPIALAIALSAGMGSALANPPDLSKVNGSLTAEAGRTYGDIDTVNGSIRVESKAIARDVETVNGSITMDTGSKAEDVGTVNGKIVLRDGVSARSVETVNGAIIGVSNIRVQHGVEAVNGSIEIGAHSTISRNVETVNGSIKLLTTSVIGHVETVNGNILIGDKTVVGGDLAVRKPTGWGINWGKPRTPRIILGPGSVVKGNLVLEREVELYVHESAKYGSIIYTESGKPATLKPIVFSGKEPDLK